LRNNTFANNTATGAYTAYNATIHSWGGSDINAYNNIFAETDSSLKNCYVGGTLTASSNNLSTDSSCDSATVVTLADLNLGALADNGGPTQTIALQSGSVAIDVGNNAEALDSDGSTALATDQRGETRISNGTVDVGAYERQPTDTDSSGGSSTTTTSSTTTSSGGGASGLLTLLFGFLGLFIRRLRPKS
jgi:hypothetical protein